MPGNTQQFYTTVSRQEVVATMRRFLYLGTVEKVRIALANEFSPDTPLPSARQIQNELDKRQRSFERRPFHRAGGA